jgi:transcriptional regulator with GAF, ATPase, and Fis domain
MNVDKNLFFQKVTLKICSSLEIETALLKSFNYLRRYIPADGMTFDITDQDGSLLSIARVTSKRAEIHDIRIPLSPDAHREGKENENVKEVMIFNGPDLNPTSKDFANILKIKEASYLVLNLPLGDNWLGGLALYALGQTLYTREHAELLFLVRKPFSIAMSNALKYREIQTFSDNIAKENQGLYRELMTISGDSIIGAESGLKEVMTLVKHVSAVESPVMLLGETGVGKDLIANAVHMGSGRRTGPIVKVNCGAIPENLIDSELFGHEKGAFTGAVSQKRGKFERANGGTLFLDEVGELSLNAQVRLLRAIQFKEIERLGGTGIVHVDARIIAATHRNLEKLIRSGKFREDLYFRLNVFPIHIQPLRERKKDIPALVHYFVEKKAKELKLYPPPELGNNAMDQLLDYDWPGNIRELSNIIERSLILNRKTPLSFNYLKPTGLTISAGETKGNSEEDQIIPFDEMITRHIRKALRKTGGRIEGPKGAATLLHLHPNTLRSKIKKFKIQFDKTPQRESQK